MKTLAKVLAVPGALALVVLGIHAYASHRLGKTWDIDAPAIAAGTGPEAVARGERIFLDACAGCHVDPARGLASGRQLTELPSGLGTFWSANLTQHADGIAEVSDALVARAIRTGVRADGKLALGMPRFTGLGDADVAALLAFLRASPPAEMLKPAEGRQPHAQLSRSRTFFLGLFAAPAPEGARTGVPVPEAKPTVEYGRYLAEEVYRCADCHTTGTPFAGGPMFEVSGGRIVASNLTPSKTHGLGEWTAIDLRRALESGISRDRYVLRWPMPRYRGATDTEFLALYVFLQQLPPRHATPKPPKHGLLAREKAAPDAKPEQLFLMLGCPTCHGKGAPYEEKIQQAKGKPVADVAAWIRNPQDKIPGTAMPTFAELITEEQALALAEYVQSTQLK